MNPLPLTMALGPYDQTRDVTDGSIPIEGVQLRTLNLPIEEIFYRFTLHREWDISEMSMGKYIALRAQGDMSMTALPVFVSRAFRHSMFYVKAGSSIQKPEDLEGKRIGIPEWAQTAGIYGRGYLSDYLGLDLARMQWVQAGVNQPGRAEKVRLTLPAGIRYASAPDKSLNQMLLDGSVDAVMTARAPAAFGTDVQRLMPDYQAAEQAYFKATRVYPIMHALVIKTAVLDAHPWVAMNVYKAFVQAKTQSMARLSDITASHAPLPWLANYAGRMQAIFGADFFPYGVGADAGGQINRATLQAFCKFGHAQGVCDRLLDVDELFSKNVLGSFKV
jgi:4,5-dihydroxyphthalate decarboxylase